MTRSKSEDATNPNEKNDPGGSGNKNASTSDQRYRKYLSSK